MVTSDIINDLDEPNRHVTTEINIYKESTSDIQDSLMSLLHPPHTARYLLSKSKIEEKTEHEIIDTNIITSESLKFLHMV